MSEDEEQKILARLQAQFGDMDVGGMLGAEETGRDVEESDESSLEEPTAEELRAWQEAQFEKGKMKLEAKKITESASGGDARKSALQRRRQNKTAGERTLMRAYKETEEAEWEHLTPTPDLGGATSVFFPTAVEGDTADAADLELAGGVNPLLQKLVEGDPEVLGTKWQRLYSSSDGDGLSFPHLCFEIKGYDGPTVLIVGGRPSPSKSLGEIAQDDRVELGFFTVDSWIESPDFFGDDDHCFMFALDKDKNGVHFFRPKAKSQSSSNLASKRFMYCHPSSLGRGKTNGSVHGLGIGGTASQPRLHLTESLEECRALRCDSLFEDGDLLLDKCSHSLYYFDVDCIEVWGVGGEDWIKDALMAREKERTIYAANLDKARKVDKSQFLDDFRSGLNNTSYADKPGLFSHVSLIEERCDL